MSAQAIEFLPSAVTPNFHDSSLPKKEMEAASAFIVTYLADPGNGSDYWYQAISWCSFSRWVIGNDAPVSDEYKRIGQSDDGGDIFTALLLLVARGYLVKDDSIERSMFFSVTSEYVEFFRRYVS